MTMGPIHRLACLAALIAAGPQAAAAGAAGDRGGFAPQIRPLFPKRCVACHGGVKRAGGLSFLMRDRVLRPAKSGAVPVVPGDPEASEVIARVAAEEDELRMPPPKHGPRLSRPEVDLLRAWVAQGA